MSERAEPDIMLVDRRMPSDLLRRLVERYFEDMVKLVVDVERRVAAVGGELHADAKALLLAHGSRQEDLWGANYYPGRGRNACIELTSLINIKPAQGDCSMTIKDPSLQERRCALAFPLVGEGEALS